MIKGLFEQYFGEPCLQQLALSANGSNRQYWRLVGEKHHAIAAYNADIRENEAFFYFSRALKERGVHVPEIYAVAPDRQYYLQEDLGDTTLYLWLYDRRRQGKGFDREALELYKHVLSDLAHIQAVGRDLDFSHAYPRAAFDRQSIQWDLNYFKYYFLKLAQIKLSSQFPGFDEQLLEEDFRALTDFLLSADCSYLLYRDFQSRNIMLVGDELTPYYIDYQGARQGAAQYDVASLLYSAKSDLPESIRQELLAHYIKELSAQLNAQFSTLNTQFSTFFYSYVLVRILQAMGAYGYRGWIEQKEYFIQSIPLALGNLRLLLENHPLPIPLPHLTQVLTSIANLSFPAAAPATVQPSTADTQLTVTVTSFSFKQGLPSDPSGNGGGFIFDCRALPNPGRYPEYRAYTGRDLPVIQFLQGDPAVEDFLKNIEKIVDASVLNYNERRFSHLSVNFGCTGGQHRSVYCAERLAQWLRERGDCHVVLIHREQK